MKTTRFSALLLLISLLLSFSLLFSSCGFLPADIADQDNHDVAVDDSGAKVPAGPGAAINLSEIPDFGSSSYYPINGNTPTFAEDEITKTSYEFYSPLDGLGRCGYAVACVGKDLMPASGETRGSIGSVTPTGWVQVGYPSLSLQYLYNRSHVIGWQLTAENANKQNLITGTRYMNENMIPYENMIADYVKETGKHVMYRAEPIFDGDNLVASGIHMEAYSVEDGGYGISFNVYLYNVQPGVTINYATGVSQMTGGNKTADDGKTAVDNGEQKGDDQSEVQTFAVNTSTHKFHLPTCRYATGKNVTEEQGTFDDMLAKSYSPCKTCFPDYDEGSD